MEWILYNIYVMNMNEGKGKDGRKKVISTVSQNVAHVSIWNGLNKHSNTVKTLIKKQVLKKKKSANFLIKSTCTCKWVTSNFLAGVIVSFRCNV